MAERTTERALAMAREMKTWPEDATQDEIEALILEHFGDDPLAEIRRAIDIMFALDMEVAGHG